MKPHWEIQFLDRFETFATRSRDAFTHAVPFPHAIYDGGFERQVLDGLLSEFPPAKDAVWERENIEGIQIKLRSAWSAENHITPRTREVVHLLNSGAFMRHLSTLTGIPHLISGPYYTGGGLNCILPGGTLDVYVDGNWHHTMAVHRRLNVILYLNEFWDPAWGGQLELWDDELKGPVRTIDPLYNRLVIFETHDKTYHGHPGPLRCPDGESRRSLILYYYTSAPRPADKNVTDVPHRALWRKLGMKPLDVLS